MNNTILIVEDDQVTSDMINVILARGGYETRTVTRALDALQVFVPTEYSAIVLSLDLDGVDGTAVLKALRDSSGLPIIVLSEKSDEVTRVRALLEGADDIMAKPFFPRELLARISVSLRRRGGSKADVARPRRSLLKSSEASSAIVTQSSNRNKVGKVSFHDDQRSVEASGFRLSLTEREYTILRTLASKSGDIVSRDELLALLETSELRGDTKIIDVYISRLRKRLKQLHGSGVEITCHRGRGWSFRDSL